MRKVRFGAAGLVLGCALAWVFPVQAQSLSQQVLSLLARANTWTALQTFAAGVGAKFANGSAPTDTSDTLYNVGHQLYFNGSALTSGGAAGTVTSVGLSLPAILTVSGSPVTGAGTLTGTLATQTANTVWAGPTSGGAVAPTFRALVDNDVPDTITIAGTNNVTWGSVNKAGSSLADLATRSASDLGSGTLALARLTNGGTSGQPLLAGASNPAYGALDLSVSTSVTGQLVAASFPTLNGDITTPGGSLTTTLASTTVVAGAYGDATHFATFTVDAKGRLTAASQVSVNPTHALLSATHTDTLAASVSRGALIYGNSSPAWAKLAVGTAGQVLRTDGTDVSWSTDGSALTALNASNVSSGTLAIARGGTNGSATPTAGAVPYGTGTAYGFTAAGTAGQCLTSNGAAAPTWGACAVLAGHALLSATHTDTLAAAVTRGGLIVGNSTPAWSNLAVGSSGQMLRTDGTDVSWSSDGSGLTLLNASSLTSGTVPLARIVGLTDAQVSNSANIQWSKLLVAGGPITAVNTSTTTWDPPSIADKSATSTTFTVSGVVVGNPCYAGLTTLTTDAMAITCQVSAANTVRVVLTNNTGGAVDLGSGTLRAVVFSF